MVKIAPSILSADFSILRDEIINVEQAGANWIHIDVMDGHFVPNLTFGSVIIEAIRPHTKLPLDVHLMIEEPDRYIQAFAQSGADIISVHQETSVHLHRTINLIKEQNVKAGVAINPATPVSTIEPILPDVDLVLIMSVNPGFGGQSLIESTLTKIQQVSQLLKEKNLTHIEIEVDGGVNIETAPTVIDYGATVLVAGSAIFGAEDRKQAIQSLQIME